MPLIVEDLTALQFTFFTFLVHEFVYFFFVSFYNLIEYFDLFHDSKIQIKHRQDDQPSKLNWFITLGFNEIFFQIPGLYFAYSTYQNVGLQFSGPLPAYSTILLQFIAYIIIDDFFFYWLHKLMHVPFFYKNFHKVHHSFKRTNALAAEYFHPIDYVVSGSIPTFMGTLIIRPHVIVVWSWLAIRIWEACDGHSGYDLVFMPFRYFPFRPGAQVHDFHHSQNVGNYGSFTVFWDWLCGTDLTYKDYCARLSAKSE